MQNRICPLCLEQNGRSFLEVDQKQYFRCETCLLIFLGCEYHPDPSFERSRYLLHENNPSDLRYRTFLQRVIDPLLAKIRPPAEGLDYGSGPGPAVASMLAEEGFNVRNYDPFFAPDAHALEMQYDFITCTETVEHFHSPAGEFERLNRLLKRGGWLGIMTEFITRESAFANWYYRRDPTHVCFYRPATFEYLARHFSWELEIPRKNVALFRKA